MTQEKFLEIRGYEGLYQISNYGRVKSLGNGKSNRSKMQILKPGKDRGGYLHVVLCKDRKPKGFLVHRLVAEHFIPNPSNLPEINHKDENKENNCVDNLEWCDTKYNINYGTRTEKCSKKVYQYTKSGEFVREWKSFISIKREKGFNHSIIWRCCNGKCKSAYNYIWTYERRVE